MSTVIKQPSPRTRTIQHCIQHQKRRRVWGCAAWKYNRPTIRYKMKQRDMQKKTRHMWSERCPVHYWHKTLHKILRLLDSTQHKHCCTVKPHKEHSLMCKIWLTLTYQTMQWGKLKRLALSKTNMQITPCTLPWKAATGLFLLRQSLSRKLTMDLIQAKLNL